MDEGTTDENGYLASYGVAIVPPPPHADGGWFVTLTHWNENAELYVGTPNGPIFETREEAMDEAQKVLDWIDEQDASEDLARVWEQMQSARSERQPWATKRHNSMGWW